MSVVSMVMILGFVVIINSVGNSVMIIMLVIFIVRWLICLCSVVWCFLCRWLLNCFSGFCIVLLCLLIWISKCMIVCRFLLLKLFVRCCSDCLCVWLVVNCCCVMLSFYDSMGSIVWKLCVMIWMFWLSDRLMFCSSCNMLMSSGNLVVMFCWWVVVWCCM